MALSSTERSRTQRERDKAFGWKTVKLRLPECLEDEVKSEAQRKLSHWLKANPPDIPVQ